MKWITWKQDGELLARYRYSKKHPESAQRVKKLNMSVIDDVITEPVIIRPCGGWRITWKIQKLIGNLKLRLEICGRHSLWSQIKKEKVNLIEKLKSMTFEERFKESGLFGPVKTRLRDWLSKCQILESTIPPAFRCLKQT